MGSPNFSSRRISKSRLLFLPLALMQPMLHRAASRIKKSRPEFFSRLGACRSKIYMIDPVNLPFVFILRPDPDRLLLRAYPRHKSVFWDARICGSFLTLFDMLDGRLDGDALFFTRTLRIEGDTEAVVTLRNACDDLEGSLAEDFFSILGPFSPLARGALDFLHQRQRQDS